MSVALLIAGLLIALLVSLLITLLIALLLVALLVAGLLILWLLVSLLLILRLLRLLILRLLILRLLCCKESGNLGKVSGLDPARHATAPHECVGGHSVGQQLTYVKRAQTLIVDKKIILIHDCKVFE